MNILDHLGRELVRSEVGVSGELRSLTLENFLEGYSAEREMGPKGALGLSTVFACLKVISDAVAETPLKLLQQTPGELQVNQIYDGNFARIAKNPAPGFFNYSNFWSSMITSLLGWGNAYALILRSNNSLPTRLMYLEPGAVCIRDDTSPRVRYMEGEPPYLYQVTLGLQTLMVPPRDLIHLRYFSYDGIRGLSPIALNAATFFIEKGQTEYAKHFYRRGGKIQGVIESPLKSTREASKEFVTWFNTFYGGQNSGQVAFLPNGLTFKGVSVVNPQDAQWVEAKQLTRAEIAAIFRVPLHFLNDLSKATWANVTQLSEEFVRYGLGPIYSQIENELNYKLLEDAASLRYEFDPSGLLRGTQSERYANYAIAVQNGWLTRSEVRSREGLDYHAELDEFLTMPGQQTQELQRSIGDIEGQLNWQATMHRSCSEALAGEVKRLSSEQDQLSRDIQRRAPINILNTQRTLQEEIKKLENRLKELGSQKTKEVGDLKMRLTKHQNALEKLRKQSNSQ